MTHRIIWALTISLLTCCSGYSGAPPIESESDTMGIFDDDDIQFETTLGNPSLIEEDPFELRARGQQSPNTNKTLPIPPRTGPWSGNNQLGFRATFEPNENNRQMIVKLDEWGLPEVWTVLLGVDFEAGNPPSNFNVVAELAMGSGGATQIVEVDWKVGTVISAPMNSLVVTALYDTGLSPDIPFELTATLAQGDSCAFAPTRTIRRQIPQGQTRTINIPKFSSYVTFMSDDFGAIGPQFTSNFQYRFLDPGGLLIGVFNGDSIGPLFSNRVPIPIGTSQLQVVNNTPGDDCGLNFIFHIDV